jgi:hypothetical protein
MTTGYACAASEMAWANHACHQSSEPQSVIRFRNDEEFFTGNLAKRICMRRRYLNRATSVLRLNKFSFPGNRFV